MPLSQLEFNQRNTATTFITGKAGNIETLITRPETLTESTPIVVISHPPSFIWGYDDE